MPYNQKSQPGGKCYRKACDFKHDWWWNSSTEAYYCQLCMLAIRKYPENRHLFTNHRVGPKHPSASNPKLKFWAELVDPNDPIPSFHIVGQVDGFPPTEAHDDWIYHFDVANNLAQAMAANQNPKPYGDIVPLVQFSNL